jgi:hexosaminidase
MINKRLSQTFTGLILVSFMSLQFLYAQEMPSDLSKASIIPKPVSVTSTGEYFTLKPGTVIYVKGESGELLKIGQYLADRLRPATGYELKVRTALKESGRRGIYLVLSGAVKDSRDEGYELTVTRKMLKISAGTPAGLFRGIQTIRQILPAGIELNNRQEGPWKIPTGTITDFPDYSYRGAMLDVARHFFNMADVMRFIDFLAYYKMNVLHLHLSDDQGWRIEIKSWPNLTNHGGSTQVGGGKGGFYTQEQYSEIIKYANDRYITIIPEIDMPGHTNAALASYAELNCDGKARELYTGTKVGFSTFCTGSEVTYKFIDDVIKELASLTPGPYIHIGGDESHVTAREDYISFVNRVQEIVTARGKKVIGWDEISLATLKPNSVAQCWSNVKNSVAAVKQGAKILMSPARKAYLDIKYDKSTKLGLNWAGYIEVDVGYNWDPATFAPGIGKENIIGIEAPLWSETVTTIDEIEYMVFPRLPGYAEIGWTPSASRNWEEYRERLGKHGERFKAMDIDFYPSTLVPWSGIQK